MRTNIKTSMLLCPTVVLLTAGGATAGEELQRIARELSSLGRQANSLLVRQR
jgi:hypothetical protein